MLEDIDLNEYFEKWAKPETRYPPWKIDVIYDILSKAMESHPLFSKMYFLAYGEQRNFTSTSYEEYLDIYVISDIIEYDNIDLIDTRSYKESIYKNLNDYKSDVYKTEDLPYTVLFKNNDINLSICPSYLYKHYIETDIFVESVIFTVSDKNNIINYPKLDNKNFDKKVKECGNNFISLIKIFKHLFLWLSKEIKYVNEIEPYFIESLIWNIPNEYFNFNRYDKGVKNSIDYIYDMVSQRDYMKISEINDIKILFSNKNNINREHILKALYDIKSYIHTRI